MKKETECYLCVLKVPMTWNGQKWTHGQLDCCRYDALVAKITQKVHA